MSPAATDVTALAVQLARPVTRGMLLIEEAEAAIAVSCMQAARAGTLPGAGNVDDVVRIATHILHLNIEQQGNARDLVASAIGRVVKPLIDKFVPIGRLRAEAHDINADHGTLLGESEVEQVVIDALYRARARIRSREAPRPRLPMVRSHYA
jgi:hypothetical protein